MECHCELIEALGNNVLSYRAVAPWLGKFQQVHVSASDKQCLSGQCVDRLGTCRHQPAHGLRQTMDATRVRESMWHRETRRLQDIA
ncbi:hypothetical protein TNCT_174911 [Trichonephila clavata]|uniref:Uncharacterized protein n=1 Tax=Trichonephila clavata TaxID=2740835 RepID=A0A8X6GEI3_TRICU|nr:hypothetical protein TNCT_174911 [Trichonephila clavata]